MPLSNSVKSPYFCLTGKRVVLFFCEQICRNYFNESFWKYLQSFQYTLIWNLQTSSYVLFYNGLLTSLILGCENLKILTGLHGAQNSPLGLTQQGFYFSEKKNSLAKLLGLKRATQRFGKTNNNFNNKPLCRTG